MESFSFKFKVSILNHQISWKTIIETIRTESGAWAGLDLGHSLLDLGHSLLVSGLNSHAIHLLACFMFGGSAAGNKERESLVSIVMPMPLPVTFSAPFPHFPALSLMESTLS